MRRRTILAVSSCLAVVLGIAPIAAMGIISYHWAQASERARLSSTAELTLQHARDTLAQVEKTLAELNATAWQDCSPAHLAAMRRLTIDYTSAEEIGYYADGRLVCTGWGTVETAIAQDVPDYVFANGAGLHLDVRPEVTSADGVVVLDYGQHNALIKPSRFVSTLAWGTSGLALVTSDWQVIASAGAIDEPLLRHILEDPANTNEHQLHAVAAADGLVAVAVAHVAASDLFGDGRWILIPIGLLVSAIFTGLVIVVSRQRLSLRSDMLHALRSGEFVAHYQPLIELSTGVCIGAEALVRWRQPNGTLVPPDLFIPYAEQDDLILELTDTVIRRVVADMASSLSGTDVHVAINVSARDMETGRFLSVLHNSLKRADIPASRIWIEATERGFINVDVARQTLEAARAAGHRVAIDDFGTGYSSLALLESLPFDALKIDKSFVGAVGMGAAPSIVTPHIIEMAHGLGLSIVAEGVETLEQVAYLRGAGVQYAQGWYYSKALPPEEFARYLENERSLRSSA